MTDKIAAVRAALAAGDTPTAQKMLRWLLKHEASAEACVLAAQHLATTPDEQISLLRQALTHDAFHTAANRLLLKLEGSTPRNLAPNEWARHTGEVPLPEIQRQRRPDRFQRHAARQRFWSRLGCVAGIIFMLSFSVAMIRAIGLLPGVINGSLALWTGRPAPVLAIAGTPLAQRPDAITTLQPSLVEVATSQDMEILDAGYLHQHTFDGYAGQEYAIYVQFLSVNAADVPRNVALIAPDGREATRLCNRGRILQGGSNLTLTCLLDRSGTWRVNVLGREGESVGTYFIGVERLDA